MKIAIGFPSYRPVDPRVDLARMDLARVLAREGIDWTAVAITQQPWLATVMNSIMHRFLQTECDRLLVLDDDVLFDAEDVLKLLESPRSVIGGDYALKTAGAGMVCKQMPDGRREGNLVECLFLGCGFSSYSYQAIVDVSNAAPAYQAGPQDPNAGQIIRAPFHVKFESGHRVDEDVTFFHSLAKAGHTPWLDTSIVLGHVGGHVYTSEDAA